MAAKKDGLLGTLDLLVLRTLTRGPRHGYGMVLHIQQVSDGALRVEEGSCIPRSIAWNKRAGSMPSGSCRNRIAAQSITS